MLGGPAQLLLEVAYALGAPPQQRAIHRAGVQLAICASAHRAICCRIGTTACSDLSLPVACRFYGSTATVATIQPAAVDAEGR
jgi:hypothetical protein